MRIHARKIQWLFLILAVDDPIVCAEDDVFGGVWSDVDALIGGIFFKGLFSFECHVSGNGFLQVSEYETQDLVNIDRCLVLTIGRKDPRHMGD